MPPGNGILGAEPLVPGVCEIGLIGERGTGLGGIGMETVPLDTHHLFLLSCSIASRHNSHKYM